MQHKHLWLILLVIQWFSVSQVKGQELQKDTISVLHPMQDKGNLRLQPVQPTSQLTMPELWNNDESLHGISIDREIASFNFKRELKYLNILSDDSSSLYMPMFPGVGDYQNFGGTLGSFNITNRLAIDYGAFISAQYGYLFSTRQIVLGTNFLLRYAITNKLQFQTWGNTLRPGTVLTPLLTCAPFSQQLISGQDCNTIPTRKQK